MKNRFFPRFLSLFLLLSLLLSGCGVEPSAVQTTEPNEVPLSFLERWKRENRVDLFLASGECSRALWLVYLQQILPDYLDEFTAAAEEIIRIDSMLEEPSHYNTSAGEDPEAPEHLKRLYDLSAKSGIPFNYAECCREEWECMNYFYCMPGECIFSIRVQTEDCGEERLYCWIYLVYNENWPELLQREDIQKGIGEGMIIPISEKWCMETVYPIDYVFSH